MEIKNKIPKKETLFPENYSRVQINVVLLDFDVLQSPQGPCVTADGARLIHNTAERHTVGALGGGMVMKLIHTENKDVKTVSSSLTQHLIKVKLLEGKGLMQT